MAIIQSNIVGRIKKSAGGMTFGTILLKNVMKSKVVVSNQKYSIEQINQQLKMFYVQLCLSSFLIYLKKFNGLNYSRKIQKIYSNLFVALLIKQFNIINNNLFISNFFTLLYENKSLSNFFITYHQSSDELGFITDYFEYSSSEFSDNFYLNMFYYNINKKEFYTSNFNFPFSSGSNDNYLPVSWSYNDNIIGLMSFFDITTKISKGCYIYKIVKSIP